MNHSDSDTKRYRLFAWPLPREETVPRTERRIANLFGVGLLTLVIVVSGLLTAAPHLGNRHGTPTMSRVLSTCAGSARPSFRTTNSN